MPTLRPLALAEGGLGAVPRQASALVVRPSRPVISRALLGAALLVAADAFAVVVALGLVAPQPVGVVLTPLALAIFALAGLYRRDACEAEELKRIFSVVTVLAALLLAVVPVAPPLDLVLFWVAGVGGVTGLRMALRSLPATRHLMRPPMVLVGLGLERDSFAYQLRANRAGRPTVLRGAPLRALAGQGRRGVAAWLKRLAVRARVPVSELQVVLLPAACESAAAQQVSEWLADLHQPFTVSLAEGSLQSRTATLSRDLGADLIMANIRPRQPSSVSRMLKRATDIVLSSVALVVLAPLMGLIWAGLLREGGAPIFAQTRLGHAGKRFQCLKFRTMRVDAEDRLALLLECNADARAEWARHQKLADDPRVTRLGRMLRASSMDELPQLINVLRGEMSLVGPRPIIAPEVPGYAADRAYFESEAFDDYASCMPGLTGLWQVCGRHRTAHAERIRLDRWYARNWSIWLDAVILLRTVRVVLMGDGK